MSNKIKTGFIGALFSIIFFFLFYHYNGYHKVFIEQGVSFLAFPFLKLGRALSSNIKKYVGTWHEARNVHYQLEVLKLKNKELLKELIAVHSALWFSHKTQELVDYAQRYQVNKQKLVHVLLTNKNDHEHFCLVDAGSFHGIEQDMVAVYKNCLVGRVSEVYPLYSKVVLITDKNCKIAAYCCKSKVCGVYQGGCADNNQGMLLFINHLHAITKDDLVVSSGQGLIFPQGFCIGTIDSWSLAGLYYEIKIKPIMSGDDIEYCYLIKKGDYT